MACYLKCPVFNNNKKIRHAKKQESVTHTARFGGGVRGGVNRNCEWPQTLYLADRYFKALIIKMFKIKGNRV